MKSYWFRIFRFRRRRRTNVRSTSVLFKRYSMFEGLELRSMLSGDGLGDSALVASDIHASPLEELSITQLMSSHLAQDGAPTAEPLAAQENNDPVAEPLVEGIVGQTILKITDLDGNEITEIKAGQNFKVEVYVDDLRTTGGIFGFYSAFARLGFDPTDVQLISPNPVDVGDFFDDLVPLVTPAENNVVAGGASSSFSAPGSDPQLLYTATFKALTLGATNFTTSLYSDVDNAWQQYGSNDKLVSDNVTFDSASLTVEGPTVSIGNVSQNEGNTGNTNFLFTVTLSEPAAGAVTVQYATQAGTATGASTGQDFVPQSGTISFEQGTTVKVITISVVGDTTSEQDETFTVALSAPVGVKLSTTAATGTATILNDDLPVISINSVSQEEGDAAGTMVFTVSLSTPPAGTVSVVYNTSNGTATAGSDYTATSGTLTFAAGETVKTITVTVTGDTTEEENETFQVTLSSPTGAVLNGGSVGTGTLLNDDGNVLSLEPTSVSQTEGDANSNMIFTVKLAEPASENVVVVYNTANGTATAGSDYTATSGTLTFAPGATEMLVTVQLLGDNLDEADETFSLVLSAPQNASIAAATAVGTILDDDGPALTVTGPATVNENSGPYVVTVSLAAASNQQVTVVYNTANGTATAGSDYTGTSGTLTFAPGETSKLITVALTGDAVKESNETFTINLTNAVNAELPASPFTATIANDDDVPTVEVIAPSPQNEGNSGSTPFVFTVKLSGASDSTITVQYATANAIAQAGSDYTATSGTLTFAPGQTQLLVTVLVIGDTVVENTDETFRLDLTNPTGATLKTGGGSATAVIVNDDSAPVITISDASVTEGDSGTKQMVFTVTLTNASNSTVTVQYATQDGSAASNGDYTATSGTLTFAANETVKTITVNIVGDLFNEEDETFRVLLSNPTNASIGDAAGIGTILDEAGDNINIVPSTISGKVFIDSNSDGSQTGIEKSLAGVTVNLTGAATMSTTTNADGSYSFGNLQPGTYTVKVVMPNQYKTASAVLGNDGGSLVDGGFTFTIENPGGANANDYHFTTKGLKAAFLSMRNFMASYLDNDSESVGEVSVSISTVTNPINASNATNTTISGTGTVGASISVVASGGGTSTAPATTTVGANGTWSISGINVLTLPDGTITYTVTATENGTTDTQTITSTKDTVAPTVDITTVTNPVNSGNDDATSVSGTGTVGATVSVVVSDGTNSTAAKTAVVGSNGQWTISGIDVTSLANGTLTYTVTIKDANGNTATDSITTTKDAEAPSLTVNTIPAFVNANTQDDFSISGTATPGSTVTIAFSGGTQTVPSRNVTVGANGNWTIDDIDLSDLPDGTVTFTITATDAANNTKQEVRTAVKNTTIAVAITDATDPVNSANKAAASISGTGEVGASVVVVITDGENEVTTTAVVVGSNGTWTVTGIDLTTLDDGEITYKVTATDEAGNTEDDEIDAVKDTVAPALDIATVTNPINIGNADAVSISGTGEVGATISVVVNDGTTDLTVTQTAVVDAQGNWTITGIDVSSLDDGTLTFKVKATDAAGNFTEDTIESEMATLAVSDVTDPITQANQTNVTISGTGQPGAEIEVVITNGDDEPVTYTTEIAEDGTWSINEMDLSDLSDGELTFTVTATAGDDEIVVTITADKDTVAVGEILEATDPVGSGNQASASITGEAEDGSTVKVWVTDGETSTTETDAAFAAGIWSLANINLTSLADGEITYKVKVTDALGNVTIYEFDAVKDTVAPVLEVNEVDGPIGIAESDSASVSGTSEAGATIKVIVSNGDDSTIEYTATANASGEWTVTGIDVSELPDGTLTFTVTAIDAAGNENEDDSVSVLKRTLDVNPLQGTISQVNEEDVTISGTGDPDATVSIIARNGAQSTTAVEVEVDADGNWTAVIDVSELADGTITFEVTASVGEDEVETTITGQKDTVAEGAILGATDLVNSENEDSAAINGTAVAGATVEVTITDGEATMGPFSVNVAENGTWSLTNLDLGMLADGEITYHVKVTDALGNVNQYEREAVKDTVAPSLTIAEVTDPIQIFNVASVDISGTGEVGATITVIVKDGTNETAPRTAVVDSEGNWTITDISVMALSDGALTFEVSAEDEAGNVNVETIQATKTTVEIVSLPDAIAQGNQASVTVGGTGQPGASVVVVASDGTNEVTSSTVIIDEAGEWSVTMNLTTLVDGEIIFTATATDGDDNTALDALTTDKDTVADGAILAATNPVNGVNAEAAGINGTAQVGSTVEVSIIHGQDDNETSVGPISAAVAGDGTWSLSGIDLSSLPDGPITFEVKVTDSLGNVSVYTLNALKDTIVTVSILTPDGSDVNAENAVAFVLSGLREAGSSIEISVTDGTHIVTETVGAGTASWSKSLDLSSLDDGTLTVLVTATDAAGNSISDTIELDKDALVSELLDLE